MKFLLLPAALSLSLVSLSHAEEASQTDWSGSSGVTGPVLDFADDFFSCSNVVRPQGRVMLRRAAVSHGVTASFDGAIMVDASDLDGDGDEDIVAVGSPSNELAWWENQDGSGLVWEKHSIHLPYSGARAVCASDVDGDLDQDIISASFGELDVTWWENTDGTALNWTRHCVDSIVRYPGFVIAADMDGDDDEDVIAAQEFLYGDVILWRNMDGAGTSWSEHKIYNGPKNATTSVYPGDFDTDGDLDVLGANYNQYEVYWWENVDGQGTVWQLHDIVPYYHPRFVFAGDINGDGFCDAAVVAENTAFVLINEGGAGTNWTYCPIDDPYSTLTSIHGADQDNDGDMDLFATEFWAGGAVKFYENVDGSGTVWAVHPVSTSFDGAYSVRTGDFNGNGTPDPTVAANAADAVSWWNVDACYPVGALTSSILYMGNDPGWGEISWNAGTSAPPGASISLQVRSGDSPDTMCAWSDTLNNSPWDLSGILAEGDSYFQYRCIFAKGIGPLSPVLSEVTLSWDPVATRTQSGPLNGSTMLLEFSPNPVTGVPVARYRLAAPAMVTLSVHDVTGRQIERLDMGEQALGGYSAVLREVPPGIYFCRMSADGFAQTRKFIVVR